MPIVTNSDLYRSVSQLLTKNKNSVMDLLERDTGDVLFKEVTVNATGVVNAPVLKYTGAIKVFNQWAIITEVTTLTNMTNVYADIWDGSVATDLTADGIDLSGAPVGTFFTKNKVVGDTYTLLKSDQARVSEIAGDDTNQPFTLNYKHGVDNYIRFNFTTTDNPVNFKMFVFFEYLKLNGSTLEFV